MSSARWTKQAKRICKGRIGEALNYACNFLKPAPRDQIRVLIFAQGRTGSTLLESLICSTGHFHEHGEILNTRRGEIVYPVQYVRGLCRRESSCNIIFHTKLSHLTRDRKRPVDPAAFLNALYGDGWHIIHLRRRNKVQHALSNIVARHRGAYHKYSDAEEEYRLHLDCDNLAERVSERLTLSEQEDRALANIDYHEVVYEDHLEKPANHQSTINSIMDFLSLEHREVSTKMRKVNTQSFEELIENYEEFVACLEKNGWQKYLAG